MRISVLLKSSSRATRHFLCRVTVKDIINPEIRELAAKFLSDNRYIALSQLLLYNRIAE